jgi:hypothetical protein|nr:MAG TPA: hypothetical protein [Caudoviricetes sp.]
MKTWLYLDDERTPSYNFSKDIDINDGENFEVYTVRSGKQFMRIIEEVNPHGISLDNDLGGSGYLSEGYQVLNEIEKLISEGRLPNLQIVRVHSANPVAKLRMVTTAKEMFQRFGRKDGIVFATYHDEPSGDKNDAVFYKNK